MRERSNINRLQRSKTMPVTVKSDSKTAHNYSSQALNSTEQARHQLRQLLAQVSLASLQAASSSQRSPASHLSITCLAQAASTALRYMYHEPLLGPPAPRSGVTILSRGR